jgi:hypothetical protein
MEDTTVLNEPNAPELSTELDTRGNEGVAPQHKEPEQEEPKAEEKAEKPISRMDALKKAAVDVDAKADAKANEKAEKPVEEKEGDKPEVSAEEKSEAKSEPVAEKQPKPSEGRRIIEAPARFLPRAKELWNNVPHPVREEFERVFKENEAEINQYREAKQFRDELKEYEDLGRQHGVSLKQALDNYVGIERKFASDPAEGFKQLFSNMGMQPQQAISHILRAFNVTPQALAQHIAQDPNAYTALARQAPQQQMPQQPTAPQPNPEVAQLRQELESIKAQSIAQQVIAPFAQEYPEYYQHEEQIAKVLKSGIIDEIHGSGLSPRDKLEAALFMVAPHAAKASVNPVQQTSVNNDDTPAVELRGTPNKSVKGSPNAGLDNSGRKGSKMSRSDAISAAMSELGIR